MKRITLLTLLLTAILAVALAGATAQVLRGRRPLLVGTA
jgi:hypothetical protein